MNRDSFITIQRSRSSGARRALWAGAMACLFAAAGAAASQINRTASAQRAIDSTSEIASPSAARCALASSEMNFEPTIASVLFRAVANACRVLYEEARVEWLVLAAALACTLGYRGCSWLLESLPSPLATVSFRVPAIATARISALRAANLAYAACLAMLAYRLAVLLGW